MKQAFLLAIQFLTRLPVSAWVLPPDESVQGRAVPFYPLVGALIGLMLCLLQMLMAESDGQLQAALLLLFWVGISGGLHLDGLADLADAWVGGQGGRERTLEIMKDPRSGPIAVTTLILLLLVKFTALSALIASGNMSGLLLAPMVGRAGLTASLRYLPYVRPGGIGEAQASHLPRAQAERALVVSALVCVLFWGWLALYLLAAVVAVFILFRQAMMRRLGGITGDAAGAVCELLEATVLVGLALSM